MISNRSACFLYTPVWLTVKQIFFLFHIVADLLQVCKKHFKKKHNIYSTQKNRWKEMSVSF